jgi:hypothetical protein
MSNEKLKNIFPIASPNTVMANALSSPLDLIYSRMKLLQNKIDSISFHVGTQINGNPHIGTYLVQAMSFYLAQKVKEETGINTKVILGALDNAPYSIEKNKEGHLFQKTYKDALGDDEINRLILENYENYFKELSDTTGVPFSIQTYSGQQASKEYRNEFLKVLPKIKELGIALNPSQNQFKIRFPNPSDKFTEKHAINTKLMNISDNKAIFESIAFNGDFYESIVTPNNGSDTYLDINTIGRNLIKELVCSNNENEMSIMIKGSDWMLGSTLVDLGHGIVGKRTDEIPLRIYTPQIVTPNGDKLSKSLINEGHQNKKDIPSYFLNMKELGNLYSNVTEKILNLCELFAFDSKHLFRSYSYNEIDRLLGFDSKQINEFVKEKKGNKQTQL